MNEQKKQHQPLDEITDLVEQNLVQDDIDGEEPSSEKADVDDLLIGAIFSDRYEIVKLIGKGGMGSVYKAKHLMLGKPVALKLLHSDLLNSERSRTRFKVEAQAASSLRHDNLTSVVDYGLTDSGQPFIVMDYVDGASLSDVLSPTSPLAEERFFNIFDQVCAGLAHAHAKGIVHRDIKPSNIMLSRNSDGKEIASIVDFGIAKQVAEESDAAQNLTRTGEIFGSPLYMSPEQCRSGSIDGRADIYSLGCVMFEALTGKPPHVGASAIETMMLHVSQKAPLITGVSEPSNWLKLVEPLVDTALAIDPKNRYQSIEALRSDLLESKLHRALPRAVQESKQSKERVKTKWKDLTSIGQAFFSRRRLFDFVLNAAVLTAIVVFFVDRQQHTPVPQFYSTQTKLTLDGAGKDLDPKIWSDLKEYKSLQNLTIMNQVIDAKKLSALNALALSELHLRNFTFEPGAVGQLSNLKTLTVLGFERPQATPENLSFFKDGGWQVLSTLPKLEKLYLTGAPIDDQSLSNFPKLPSLSYLVLKGTAVHGSGLPNLKEALPALKDLDISGTKFGDKDAHYVLHLTLRNLTARETRLTMTGVATLCQADSSLQSLLIGHCQGVPTESLDLLGVRFDRVKIRE